MIPRFPDFRPIELSDREEFETRLRECDARVCELSFVNFHIWKDVDRPMATEINGNICVLLDPLYEPPFFLQPVGRNKIEETVGLCIERAGRVSRASAKVADEVRGNGFAMERLPEHFDYVFRVQDLAELKGRRFDGKRNHIKRFKASAGSYSCVDLTAEHGDDALAVFDAWRAAKGAAPADCGAEELKYSCQRRALERAFGAFSELGLFGSAMIVDEKLAGFMLGAGLAPDTACVHLAYQSDDYPGITQAMLWETCRRSLQGFEYVNLEQDLGIPGLRKHKSSYHPVHMVEKYEITPRSPI